MRNCFIWWIIRLSSGFISDQWNESDQYVIYMDWFIFFQSQNVPKKQKCWGGRMNSLSIENNPGARSALSWTGLEKQEFQPDAFTHWASVTDSKCTGTRRRSALSHSTDVYRADRSGQSSVTHLTFFLRSFLSVSMPCQCKKIKKADKTKRKNIYPYYKSLKNSSLLFRSYNVKKITPAVLMLK